jgi:hypothetical protein
MGNERLWNIGGMILARKKLKYSEKTQSQCQLFPHKPHMDWPGIELSPPR